MVAPTPDRIDTPSNTRVADDDHQRRFADRTLARQYLSVGGDGGSRTSHSPQPVIVRTYSPLSSRASSMPRSPPSSNALAFALERAKLPPVEAFSFPAIMQNMDRDVHDVLDAIAEIYSKTRLSLADEYAAHMPPQGEISVPIPKRSTHPYRLLDATERNLPAVPEASSSNERLAGQTEDRRSKDPENVEQIPQQEYAVSSSIDRRFIMLPQGDANTPSLERGRLAVRSFDHRASLKIQSLTSLTCDIQSLTSLTCDNGMTPSFSYGQLPFDAADGQRRPSTMARLGASLKGWIFFESSSVDIEASSRAIVDAESSLKETMKRLYC